MRGGRLFLPIPPSEEGTLVDAKLGVLEVLSSQLAMVVLELCFGKRERCTNPSLDVEKD